MRTIAMVKLSPMRKGSNLLIAVIEYYVRRLQDCVRAVTDGRRESHTYVCDTSSIILSGSISLAVLTSCCNEVYTRHCCHLIVVALQ
jgi:hypothetical protein